MALLLTVWRAVLTKHSAARVFLEGEKDRRRCKEVLLLPLEPFMASLPQEFSSVKTIDYGRLDTSNVVICYTSEELLVGVAVEILMVREK